MAGTCSGTVSVTSIIGSASFSSTPPGAELFIDGADQGVKTPSAVTNLPAGTHTFMLKLIGYNDATGSFTITAGQTATVAVSLTPVKKGGAGTLIGLTLLGIGALGAVVFATRKKPQS